MSKKRQNKLHGTVEKLIKPYDPSASEKTQIGVRDADGNKLSAVSAQGTLANLGPAEVAFTLHGQTEVLAFAITCRTPAVTQQSLRILESRLPSQFVVQHDSIGESVPP
jgi:hypothetical protein